MFADVFWPAKMQLPSAPGPKQKFHRALHIAERIGIRARPDDGCKTREQTIFTFQPDDQRHGVTGGFRGGEVLTIKQHRRLKTGVERGNKFHFEVHKIYFPAGFKSQNTVPAESVPPEPATCARSV